MIAYIITNRIIHSLILYVINNMIFYLTENLWQFAQVSISEWATTIVFRVQRANGYRGDFALDDILFSKEPCA